MFLMMGITQKQKDLREQGPLICDACGAYGRYRAYVTYMCFSLFFIPVFKWNKKYYVEMTCCHSLYELAPWIGKRLMRGEDVEILQKDLTIISRGRNPWENSYSGERTRRCAFCGFETREDYDYCPKCGRRME